MNVRASPTGRGFAQGTLVFRDFDVVRIPQEG